MSHSQPLLQSALGNKANRYPVWFMRQAGRYLPEYQKIRSQYSFLESCRSPEIAATITLQPMDRFDLDAAIIFSDILMIPTILGQDLRFDKGHGPILSPAIRTVDQVKKISQIELGNSLDFVGEAISIVRDKVPHSKSVIGFAGAPFTVLCYMVDGGGSKTFLETKKLLYTQPEAFALLLQKIADITFDYLKMQVKAGANALMLFDSWANTLTDASYKKMVFPVTNNLIKKIKQETNTPIIYYPGQDSSRLYQLSGFSGDVISCDWRVSIDKATEILKSQDINVCVQGNLDPTILFSDKSKIVEQVEIVLEKAKMAKSHIFNVGHGLLPETPISSLTTVIETIRNYESRL